VKLIKGGLLFIFIAILAFSFGCASGGAANRKRARTKANLGSSLIEDGRTGAGIKHLLDAAELDPESADIQHELAVGFRNMGEYQRSLTHFMKCLELRPSFPEAWNNLGTLYLIQRQWDQAIASFRKALSFVTYKTPQFAYNNLGLAYYGKGEYQRAVENHRRALKLSPDYSVCHDNLARVYEKLNLEEQAIQSYKRAIYYAPGNPGPHYYLGRLYLRLGLEEEATKELLKTLELDPHGPYGDGASRALKGIRKESSPRE
jgi:tetratricopeptide (TPR) repeat protein